MADLTQFEAQVENARLNYVAASDRRDPGAYELFQSYWTLLRDYNLAWTQDAAERLHLDRADDEAGVLMRVVDEEYNEAGLTPKYFADRLREANLGRPPAEDDVWQIIASDQYRETHWVSSKPLRSHMAEIEALTTVKVPEMDTAPVTIDDQIDEISAEDQSEEPSLVVKGRRDVAAEVTQKIIDQLEAGTVPWHKPWASTGGRLPISLSTGKPYHGTNSLLLGISAMCNGYTSPLWGTFHQIKELGGAVIKGEHGTMVIIYKPIVKESTNAAGESVEERKGVMLRSYIVFNLSQTSGLDHLLAVEEGVRNEHERIAECEAVVQAYLANGGPKLAHDGGGRAFYSPKDDRVALPEFETFETPEGYYSTLFHELTHSTGHSSRLNREGDLGDHYFGSPLYAKEELIAELGAAMSCASLGIDQTATIPQSAAYIENWLTALRNDRSLVLKASAGAQKAVEIIGVNMDHEVSLVAEQEVALRIEDIAAVLDAPKGLGVSLLGTEAGTSPVRDIHRPSLSELEGAVASARQELQRCQAGCEITTVIQELSELAAQDEVIACEDAVVVERRRIKEQVGHVVLSGQALNHDMDLVRAEITRSEQMLRERSGVEPRVFACRRNESARCVLRSLIRNAVPVSEEKERLQHRMTVLEEDYALLSDPEADESALNALIERIQVENPVDEAWLLAQKAELEMVQPVREAGRVPLSDHSPSR